MKRKIYPIHKDFKNWNKVNPPINNFFAPIMQTFLRPIFKMEKSNEVCLVERKTFVSKNNKKVNFLIYTPKMCKKIILV